MMKVPPPVAFYPNGKSLQVGEVFWHSVVVTTVCLFLIVTISIL